MLSTGVSDGHSNRFRFADFDGIDELEWYVVAVHYAHVTDGTGERFFLWKGADAGSGAGWGIGMTTGELLRVRHRTSGGSNQVASADVYYAVEGGNPIHSLMVAFNKAAGYVRVYQDAALFESISFSDAIGDAAGGLRIGAAQDTSGPAMILGQIMLWANKLSEMPFTTANLDAMAQLYDAGKSIPNPDYLRYWIRGTNATTIINEITREEATIDGTVTLSSNPTVDAYFTEQPYTPAWRDSGSRRLRRDRFPVFVYDAQLNASGAQYEIADDVGLVPFGLPRAASHIRQDGDLVRSGQPIYSLVGGITFDPNTFRHGIELEDLEHIAATIWVTYKLPYEVDTGQDGLAQIDTGAVKTFSRNNDGWVRDANGLLVKVGAGYEKLNHIGYASEDGRRNLLTNSALQNGAAGWTGTTGFSTTQLFFKDLESYPEMHVVGNGEHREQTFSVVTVDGAHRFQIWHFDQTNGILRWRLQRDTDSWYWNDTTGAWQASEVFNALPQVDENTQVYSSFPIDCDQDEDWTLRIDCTGSGSDSSWVGQVDLQNTRYALSPIVTDETGDREELEDTLAYVVDGDADRQIVYARRHTVRLTYYCWQDVDVVPDDAQLALYYCQYGADEDESIVGYYTKPAGSSARFVMEARQGGSIVATAYKEWDIARGDSLELEFRLVDETGDELQLKARTMSVLVNGERGIDDQLPASYSTAEDHTELMVGAAPAALGMNRANGIVSDLDVQQLCVPDESALAVR